MMLTTTIPSQDRTYIMMTASSVSGYHFTQFQLPEHYDNNPAIAANIWQKTYLETTPTDQAGLLVAVIPIEQFKLDQLSQIHSSQSSLEPSFNDLSNEAFNDSSRQTAILQLALSFAAANIDALVEAHWNDLENKSDHPLLTPANQEQTAEAMRTLSEALLSRLDSWRNY